MAPVLRVILGGVASGGGGIRKAIGGARLVHGAPRSDRGVNRPPRYTGLSAVVASEKPAGHAPAWQSSGRLKGSTPNRYEGGSGPRARSRTRISFRFEQAPREPALACKSSTDGPRVFAEGRT